MNDLTNYMALKAEIEQLKKQVRKLQCENSTLRALTGRKKRKARKNAIIKHYKEGITGAQLAELAGCSLRYANFVKRMIEGKE